MFQFVITFLFIIYILLECFKFNKGIHKKDGKVVVKKELNRAVVYIKAFIIATLLILLTINHFTDTLSKSGGVRSFLCVIFLTCIMIGVSIRDILKIRRLDKK